jgi:hypothetical protein
MALQLAAFPDAEDTGMAILDPLGYTTVTSTPDPIVPPVIRVNRVGGSDDRIIDSPRLEIAVYGATRPQAWAIAEQCRQTILAARRTEVALPSGMVVLVDTADTVAAAAQVPYENPDIRRVVAIYELSYRRPRA